MLKARKLWQADSAQDDSAQAGFTLIEIILVMVISMMLLAAAFIGQRGLRSQAQFDAAVNKLVATVADAHTQATAGVNIVGGGDGANGCSGAAPSGSYVFAGIAWTADNSLPASPLKVAYYKARPGVEACVFDTRTISLPAPVQVNASNPPSTQGGRMLYVRTDSGGLNVCRVLDLAADVLPSFKTGTCTSGTLTLNLSDSDGHSAQVIIDDSGLARRAN